jgi:hypothetical protein
MGHDATNEALPTRRAGLGAAPRWHDIAGKTKMNGRGVIEMSPATNLHGIMQLAIGATLREQLPAATSR